MKEMKRLKKLKANNCLLEYKKKPPEEIVPLQFSIFQSGSQNRWTAGYSGQKPEKKNKEKCWRLQLFFLVNKITSLNSSKSKTDTKSQSDSVIDRIECIKLTAIFHTKGAV